MFQNITIKTKLIGLTVVSLLILATILTISSVMQVTNKMIENESYKLESIRDSKTNQITKFFNERIGDINVLARSSDIRQLVIDFEKINDKIDIDTKGKYPISNELVKKITKPFEPFFQSYAKDYGYYDVFLINLDGQVVYSQAKESDYGANISTGNLKTSGLGEVFRKANQNNRPTFVDMKPYAPSAGAPAMFLGTPVVKDGEKVAILVFQVSDASINEIMQFRKGYGQSQEDYLVGPDKKMRSDSFLDPKGHSLKASFANPDSGKVNTVASNEALKGNTNTQIVIDYNGNPVLSAYSSLKVGEDLQWAILSEIDEAELLQTPYAIGLQIALISLVLLVVISFITVGLINKGIVKPLREFEVGLLGFFKYINREQNDVNDLNTNSNDEIGNMSRVVNDNIHKTKASIDEDRKVIDDTITVLAEFEQGDLCQRVNTSSSNPALQELTNLLNQMGTNMEKNIDGVLSILEQYSNYNYVNKVETNSIKEHLLRLANGVNSLGDSITGMLVENKQTGLTLDKSSDILLENVEILNSNSNQAAAALEETAAALEEVTSNVSHTTTNVVQMAKYASEVTASAQHGQELANQTTKAMDEINDEVTSISEAITVIDQIAFQTNILSLNAAVEAATAGEAGKGFAVVAQEVRNLAARSADAANEIKALVEKANDKANSGKDIADKMIAGYTGLNESITKTIDLISDVETASKEQQAGIVQINDAVNSLDRQTQENANIASQTQEVAMETDIISKEVLNSVNEKDFIGKDAVKAKSTPHKELQKQTATPKVENKSAAIPTAPKAVKTAPATNITPITSSTNDDEWASF